ncbi:MAG: NAD-dependent epimerase [Gammaproteobacteria bacterium]|nr:NAD-dependent epimerase [Gammaproteobacteria bacterium]
MKVFVTGAAGFIGFHLTKALLLRGDEVVGLDNLNDYYDPQLKHDRLAQLPSDGFTFYKADLEDTSAIEQIFSEHQFDCVVNLAAQAGVRYSLQNPRAYINSNLVGFLNILEACRHNKVVNLVFASSSSVYGANAKYPFSEHDNIDHPVSLYAATKKSNELMAHSYASLYGLPVTGLRFFTVYGPWGRPDMALFKFTKNILADQPIELFNNGQMLRDFTYVDDIVAGIIKTVDHPAEVNPDWSGLSPDPATSYAPYTVFNIGNNQPIKLLDFVSAVEKALNKKAIKKLMPMQAGDVEKTYADTAKLEEAFDYKPSTSIEEGIQRFINWYVEYFAGSCHVTT